MLRACTPEDFPHILEIINDGAQAYRGVIPVDRFADPYMPAEKLKHEITDGVLFYGIEQDGALQAVMGLQHVQDVTLIRHAYVRSTKQKRGLGGKLLSHLRELTQQPVLIGTWADAAWAIAFYQRNGFQVVTPEEKEILLRRYWNIPERQVATSVVLADPAWRARSGQPVSVIN